ncbi:MAG TPA: glycosyltransferase, partial [Gemmatimonadales bacterium]|nr:glycosyltransferase [Gemmatimonadales bacterium]
MACGCPVVASETGACPEITAGAGLLANPYRAEDFAGKILRVLEDGGLRHELRERGLQRAAFFRWDRSARAVLQKMREIVEQASGVAESARSRSRFALRH